MWKNATAPHKNISKYVTFADDDPHVDGKEDHSHRKSLLNLINR